MEGDLSCNSMKPLQVAEYATVPKINSLSPRIEHGYKVTVHKDNSRGGLLFVLRVLASGSSTTSTCHGRTVQARSNLQVPMTARSVLSITALDELQRMTFPFLPVPNARHFHP